jgi:hypothetical protein
VPLELSSGHFFPIRNKFNEQKQAKCDPFSVELKLVDFSEHLAVSEPQIPIRLHIPINNNNR